MKAHYIVFGMVMFNIVLQAEVPAKRTLTEHECVKEMYHTLKDSLKSEVKKEETHNRLKGLVTRYDKCDKPWVLYKKVEDYAHNLNDKEVEKEASIYWSCYLYIEFCKVEKRRREAKEHYDLACKEAESRAQELQEFIHKNITVERLKR